MRKPFILVVEDDPSTSALLQRALGAAGYQVRTARTVVDGMAASFFRKPDLILMDVHLPVMDGATGARAFKVDPGLREVPVILVSGLPEADLARRSEEAQAAGYVCKPFKPASLLETVQKLAPVEN